ncbi:VOC family protein [Nocardioides plantarum]|uniref:VOC family protein n=1 Tax=Nocardioides plantarum TaxID=29299 RepID=A0ABV5KEB5_9ACTN|nr:VOC family protein [Nocardioides plantarum]
MSRELQVTFDCADPDTLMRFWCQALGYVPDPPPPGFETWDAALDAYDVPLEERNTRSACHDPEGTGPRLFFQQVAEAKTAKNRVHLDVRAAPGLHGEERMTAIEAEAERLVAAGATRLARFEPDPPLSHGFIVLADPEGNELCLD